MIAKAVLAGVWTVIIYFILSVGQDVLDRAPSDSCDYCKISNNTIVKRKFFENDELQAFNAPEANCKKHFLVIPKQHIKNIHSYESNCELILKMLNVCNELLSNSEREKLKNRIFFDNPPLYDVKHLHLNCMGCDTTDESQFSTRFYYNSFREFASPDITQKCETNKTITQYF